jgi:hypothetical protein
MRGSSSRHALAASVAFALAALAAAHPARAADEEIQVYMDEMNDPGRFGLDVHLNYVPQGRGPDADYAGQMTSERRWRVTPEWSYGLTKNIELGLYLPLMTFDPHGGAEWGGVKGRVKFIAPHAKDSPFFWGVNYELGRVRRELDINPWNAELKFIGGYRNGPWTLAGNINIDWMVSGPDHTPVDYQLATKASYALREDLSVGLESYNGLGSGRQFGRLGQSDQSTYVVADKSFGKWDLNLGVGYGYGHPEDRWTVKAIIGVPIDWR